MRPACHPGLDPRRPVSGVVVHHEMDVRPFRHGGIDTFEKVEELGCPMTLVAFADDGARGDVERCEQGRRTVADISGGAPLRHAQRQGQNRPLAIQHLDLRLFVDAQHARPIGRVTCTDRQCPAPGRRTVDRWTA